jgi:CBS domain-containing protein
MQVEKLMIRDVKSCGPQDDLNTAAQIMWDYACGCVPVLDENQRVVGMLTDRDVCMAAYTQGKPLHDIQVSTAMSRSVFFCSPSDDIARAQKLLRENRIHRLPVLDAEGKLVGVLSLDDLALETERERKGIAKRELTAAEIAETLAAVCHPRVTAAA